MGMEVMRELIKHSLSFEKTIAYFKEQIEMDNVLSKCVLESVSFEEGSFYTLLTSDANLSKVYQFKVGHILPPNPLQKVNNPKSKSVSEFEWINSIDDEFAEYLSNILKQSSNKICIFDDALREIDELDELVKEKVAISIDKEVYYILTKESQFSSIKKVLKNSQNFWHCLGIITTYQLKKSQVDHTDFKELCQKIELIITEAYDGEGYLMWEKNTSN